MSRAGVTAALVGVVVGAAAGAAAGAGAFWTLTGPLFQHDVRLGEWTTVPSVGEAGQSPYTRARVALYGIWGLPPSEVVYFTGDRDASAAPLQRDCTYAVRGGLLPARFWSLTLYRDGFFIPNASNRYSWSSADAQVGPSGAWTVTLASSGEGRNRLTFGARGGRFQLSLRLYQPKSGIAEHRERTPLPVVVRLSCAA